MCQLVLVLPHSTHNLHGADDPVRRVMTYIQSTMTQLRFNNFLVLHVHKEWTDTLEVTDKWKMLKYGNQSTETGSEKKSDSSERGQIEICIKVPKFP